MRIFRPKWKDKDGKTVEGSKYSVQFGHLGKTYKFSLGTSDKRVAERKGRKLKEEVELEAAGIADPFKRQRHRPLREHVDEFLAYLASKDVTKGHVADRKLSLREWLDATVAKTLAQIDFVEVQRWLADLGERAERPLSARSVNKRYQALRQFGAWVVQTRRFDRDPFACLQRRNEDLDPRRPRRALSRAEVLRLLEVARSRPLDEAKRRRVRVGVSDAERVRLSIVGAVRAYLYRFALGTGLRRGELAGLSWADVDSHHCTLTVRADVSKSRERQTLPLQAALAADLDEHRERLISMGHGASAQDRVFPSRLFPISRTFRRDLAAATLDGRDESGRVVDFHSFRITFITRLFEAGVPPRTVQALARHSRIDLTTKVYTDLSLLNLRGAVAALEEDRAEAVEVAQQRSALVR